MWRKPTTSNVRHQKRNLPDRIPTLYGLVRQRPLTRAYALRLAAGSLGTRHIRRAVWRKPTTSNVRATKKRNLPDRIPTLYGLVRQRPLTRAYALRLAARWGLAISGEPCGVSPRPATFAQPNKRNLPDRIPTLYGLVRQRPLTRAYALRLAAGVAGIRRGSRRGIRRVLTPRRRFSAGAYRPFFLGLETHPWSVGTDLAARAIRLLFLRICESASLD